MTDTCSIALLVLPAGGRTHATDELAQELARMKTAAKKSASSFSMAMMATGDAVRAAAEMALMKAAV